MRKEKLMRNKIEKSPVRESLFKRVFGRLAKEEDGFAMEYVIIVLLVAAGVIAVVMVFSDSLRNMFTATTGGTTSGTIDEVEATVEEYRGKQDATKKNAAKAQKIGEQFGTGNSKNPAPATPPVPEG